MEAATSILVAVASRVIESWRPDWKKAQVGLLHRLAEEIPRALAEHHDYVARWCQEAHSTTFAPVPTDAPTVELEFQQVPRSLGIGGAQLDELDLLCDPGHIALLGDLGAGKTTTLRRLAGAVSLTAPSSPDDPWKFAIAVVCREEQWDKVGLYDVLGRIVGISDRLVRDLDNPQSRIRDVLNSGCLVLIDGLDEVPRALRGNLDRDIAHLGRHLTNAKIIVSCRSADYVAPLPGFQTAEIRPLGADQIKGLVRGLLGAEAAAAFYQDLSSHPAADLADRPLFLTYMAAIYRQRGSIPERPIDLYEAIVRLVIQEWDEQRGVQRVSKWAGFGVDDKRRFLADLAFELTRLETIRFEEWQLIDIYDHLADRYELPKTQGRMVAKELESHTGLMVQVGAVFYEFSHLALQEYLAADSLVRGPSATRADWWKTFPAVAAVSVAMSSDPNRWLHELVEAMPRNLDDIRPLQVFLDRLGQERPRFMRSAVLGGDLLHLVERGHINDAAPVARLGSMRAVRDSVADALNIFERLTVGVATTRAASYPPRSAVPSKARQAPTPVMVALVGEERLRQIERSKAKRSELGG